MKNLFYLITILSFTLACSNEKPAQDGEEKPDATIEEKIKGEEVSYSGDSITMEGYIAYDQAIEEKRPGIIVVHEWWGHNDYVRKRADMLAELGYVALAVDMYGDGQQAEHPKDAGKFAGMVMSDIDGAKARFDAALEVLKAHDMVDPEKISAIGYCFGGSVVLSMANAGYDLDAAAAFHSGVELPVPPSEDLQAKVLVANGADDPMITDEQQNAFEEKMKEVNADFKYIEYPNTVHAYTNPGADSLGQKFELPLAYNKEADEKSWKELKSLLNSVYEK